MASPEGSALDRGPLGAALILLFFSILCVVGIVHEHTKNLYSIPLQRLAMRIVLLAPIYVFFIILTAYTGHHLKPLWEIIMAIYDGFVLYCFFGLIILGTGDYRSVIASLIPKPPLTIRVLCIPLQFENPDALYRFLSRSVLQVVISRPVFLALSALVALAQPTGSAPKALRALGILCLVYAVLTIGKTYHLIYPQIWKAFSPVITFFVVKTFILLIAVQDFVLTVLMTSPKFHLSAQSATAWHVYAVLVAVEAILYLLLLRNCFHYSIFQAFNTDAKKQEGRGAEFVRAILHFPSVIDEDDGAANSSSEGSPMTSHPDAASSERGITLQEVRASA